MLDPRKNFAYSEVATAPSPATSGTSLVVTAGQGTRFPAVPFNATVWAAGAVPIPTNAEIVRVTTVSTDTLTITRAQEGSTARSIVVTDQIAATVTNKTLTDLENLHDPVFVTLGTPTTAFEFDTTSLTGLTALGTPDVEDANTTVPGHYYLRDDDNEWVGRWVAATSPFTCVTKISDATRSAVDGHKIGLFVGDSAPVLSTGDAEAIVVGNASYGVWVEKTGTSNVTNETVQGPAFPMYFAIRVNSTTDVDYLWSANGLIWKKIVDSRNPSLTLASCGIVMIFPVADRGGAWDYLRIWNSAIALPGATA